MEHQQLHHVLRILAVSCSDSVKRGAEAMLIPL
jgi:hypothetical protein